jgi:hypothetical protein
MKIKQLLCFLALLLLVAGFREPPFDCSPPAATTEFGVNNVRATFGHGGVIWEEGYFVPGDLPEFASVSAMRNGFLWFGGMDEGGNLEISADWKDNFTEGNDFYSGPLMVSENPNISGTTNAANCFLFDNHFTVSQIDIEVFKLDYEIDGQLDEPNVNVLNWPGSGNPYYEEEYNVSLPVQPLAPFVDLNGNGIYEPAEGEYPAIKGDAATWWVINDNGNIHTNTNGQPTQFEIGILAYAYDSEEAAINNATFYELTLYNRAIETLDSAYAALAIQLGLGCPDDDYFGSIPGEDIAYVYNADDVDGVNNCSCPLNYNTYCQEVPVLGFKFLETPENKLGADRHLSSVGYFNDLLGASKTKRPNDQLEYYNRLAGKWNDNTDYLDQGDGTSSGNLTNYMFAGNPANGQGQSMCNEQLEEDYRTMILSTGPYRFEPSASGKIAFAVFFMENTGACPDTGPIIGTGKLIKDFYDNTVVSTTAAPSLYTAEMLASPNPARNSIRLQASHAIERLSIYDASGKPVRQYSRIHQDHFEVERGALPPGKYFYKAQLENGQQGSGKIVFVN